LYSNNYLQGLRKVFSKQVVVVGGIVFLALAVVGAFFLYTSLRINNLPGTVIGHNPKHIRESDLPQCEFTGANFIKTPCYSPPGSIYL
jgi:hypothetical protein